ncbi:hypothetical protein V6C53_12555 [Desulfocurvibacter africanus]|uniref:Uncharacterized protein n=1 Tax=Desulfocurvibacter africanus subsp. africanus str. Walvis Bay TaxID=690850 RepID=F3YUE0_DESAF|nr:hypothetical protein [Desulfocurvibacter africanus]EGJ48822.1 hypothetical protein Desaf_0468 [Desulfocurvibacter africanus subsp. africanus str. Walvis Bay]
MEGIDDIGRMEAVRQAGQAARWAGARLVFGGSVAVSMLTVVGGIPLLPYFSWWFFGSPRFWEQGRLPQLVRLWLYSYPLAINVARRKVGVGSPLFKEPRAAPDPALVEVSPDFVGTSACGDCTRCCEQIKCPLHDKTTGYCLSYGSPHWRYLNCGRYPESQGDIDFYGCPKWRVRQTE